MKYLDLNGIKYFWSKIKVEIQKLQTMIDEKAPSVHTHTKSQISDFPSSLPANGGNADTVNGHTVEANVPANAKFTDTVYSHPNTHPADMIVQDGSHRFVSDSEKENWNDKASTATASESENGLMSAADKMKLDNIEAEANKYIHPSSHVASMITQDSTHRFVSDTEKSTWNAKPDTKADIGLSNVTNDSQVKRSEMGVASGVATLDSNGKVPSSQLPSYVDDVLEYSGVSFFPEKGETGKIYTDSSTNKVYRWSGSSYVEISASLALGETSSTAYAGDKGKTNADEITKIKSGTTVVPKASDAATVSGHTVEIDVPSNAKFTDTVYAHPSTHPATMITQDSTHRFVTDTQISTWSAKASTAVATSSANGLMSSSDKSKLEGIASGANNYSLPTASSSTKGGILIGFMESGKNYPVELDSSGKAYVNVPWTDTNTTYTLSSFGITTTATELNYMDGVTSNVQTQLNGKLSTNGTAVKATADSSGQNIADTYIKDLSVSGRTITYTKGDGATGTITTQDTNTTYSNMKGATASTAGTAGLVPAPAAGKQSQYLRGDGTWATPTNTTYSTATTSSNGLMSSTDKTKLDGIATGANKYVLPTATSTVDGGVRIGYPESGKNYPVELDSSHRMFVNVPWTDTNTTYVVATQSANGLMSSTDKKKLDGIATGANKTVVDSSLSSSSTNPVQNKVVKAALDRKAASSHTHTGTQITQDSTHRFVTDTEKAKWNDAVEKLQKAIFFK